MTTLTAEDRLLTEAEAAAYLGVSKQTLAIWRCTGRYKLPFVRLSPRAIRYSKAQLAWFVAQRTSISTKAADAKEEQLAS